MSEPYWSALGGGAVDYEGAWNPATAYAPGDVVRHNGIDYLAVNPSTGVNPGTATGLTRLRSATPLFHGAATSWPDAATANLSFFFIVPLDYAGGDITLKVLRRAVALGTAVMRKDSYRLRENAAAFAIDASVNVNFVIADTNVHLLTAVIPAANFQIGDSLLWGISRLGADAGDTTAGILAFDGASVEYLGGTT